jgi:hypothetical protein
MKTKHLTLLLTCSPLLALAQEQNPAYQHDIPDKVFELAIPLMIIILLFYTIISVFRIVTDNRTRQRLIDKGVSDEALKQMLLNGNKRLTLEALKWGLILGFTGIALLICHFIPFGYLTFAVLFIAIALGLLVFSFISKGRQ